jgi:hypothetical protein
MKTILTLVVIVFAALSSSAQKTDVSKVPVTVKNAFEKAYPGVTAKWEKEDGNYEVSFKQSGSDMSVVIDAKGSILQTEMGISSTKLPSSALDYVKAHYKGKNIKESAKITKADGTVNYEAQVAGKDVIFDANGKFLKEVKE